MLGLIVTILFSIGAAGLGALALKRLSTNLDPALAFGVHGLTGLAIVGMATLPIALLPGGTKWGMYVVGAAALVGYWPLVTNRPSLKPPGSYKALILLGALLAALCAVVAVLAPSDSLDWDTLAYHLAVPKMWIQDGQMHYVSFIHQSNFPLTVDGLYIWGLDWGGESGAKAFSLCFAIYGAIALFGFARGKYGDAAGWWSLLAYVAIPMVAWEAGTGYIDVSNGLFIGLGILFAATYAAQPSEKQNLWLGAIFLGFGAGSKYTGLQTIGVVAAVLIVCSLAARRKQGSVVPSVKGAVLMAVVAFAICSPWYIRNIVNTGNPVFPFFYSIFGGKNWDAFSDQIYKEQQQTFGAGRAMQTPDKPYTTNSLDPTRVGHAVLGLAYQPGRYADPSPTGGMGFPFVSLGAVGLGGLLAWLLSGRSTRFELIVAASVLVSLGGWFVLSEQSRYILGLIFPLCVITGGAVSKLKVGPILAGAAAVQLLAVLFVLTRYQDEFTDKLRVVLGGQSREDYLTHHVGFYEPAQALNQLAKNGKVGLFDEVFGFYLDVPYFWASPGHSTQMGYEQMQTPEEFVSALKKLEITHVYINLGQMFGQDKSLIGRWRQAAGLDGPAQPYEDRDAKMKDPRDKYKVLLAEAISHHYLQPIQAQGGRLIFAVP